MTREILPLYFVIDESGSMGPNGGINAVNGALPELHATIASDPVVSDKCRIGLVTFADTAVELMSLTNLAEVVAMPGLQARGVSRLRPVWDLLRLIIQRDLAILKSQGLGVERPIIFIILGSEPTDSGEWEQTHRGLLEGCSVRPHIIAFGVDGVDAATIGKVGTLGAYISDPGISPAEALAEALRGRPGGGMAPDDEPNHATLDPGPPTTFPIVISPISEIGSGHPTRQGGAMTTEYATGENILPFYIVCDESGSMGPNGGINAINGALPELHATIASDPLVSDKCRIGLITFSDTAEELMSLTNLADVVAMPGMQARGLTNYGQVFDLLKTVISRDIANLKGQGYKVYRPAVFFITDGEPTDVATWESSYRSLVDKTTNRHAPNIIAFGVDGADASTIGKVGTLGAFVSTSGVSPADSLREIIGSLTNTIFDSASSANPQLVVPAAPAGTTAVPLEEV